MELQHQQKHFLKDYISDIYLDAQYLSKLKNDMYGQSDVKHLILPDFFKDSFMESISRELES